MKRKTWMPHIKIGLFSFVILQLAKSNIFLADKN